MRSFFLRPLILASLLPLAACQGFNPVIDTMLGQFGSQQVVYQPGFEYLEVRLHGRRAAMALGSREVRGDAVHEYWYSGQREMIHLINGRISEALGMTHEIRGTVGGAPGWARLTQSDRPLVWSRSRDVMPKYRYGVREFVISQKVMPTAAEKKAVGPDAVWVEEEVKSQHADGRDWIYREQFALKNGLVVYSVQCIAPELCVELKPLGVVVAK